MKPPPAFQVYARDFLVDETARLSLAATGAYMRLLCHQWLAGSLPAGVAQLAKLTGVPTRRFRRLWREIADQFPLSPHGGRANAALEERRLESDAYRQRQAEAGRRGARVRWLKSVK